MEPQALKDELKYVTTMPGALSVMIHGRKLMLLWHADNLDSIPPVNFLDEF